MGIPIEFKSVRLPERSQKKCKLCKSRAHRELPVNGEVIFVCNDCVKIVQAQESSACTFCAAETDFAHHANGAYIPVCEKCAKSHNVRDLRAILRASSNAS